MTRKHFVAIAEALSELRNSSRDSDSVDKAARAIADVCAKSNGQFNRFRFLQACGV